MTRRSKYSPEVKERAVMKPSRAPRAGRVGWLPNLIWMKVHPDFANLYGEE